MVRYITTEEIIDEMLKMKRKDNWDYQPKIINEIKTKYANVKCKKYSMKHYEIIYCLIHKNINRYNETIEKIAYLDCLRMNYTSLKDVSSLDMIISLLTGGALGVSFDNCIDDWLKIFLIVSSLAIFFIKLFVLNNKRWDFFT